ncbi:pentatricopeptide repeat-containing protein At2g20710, mitochondrial-like [Pistacia vera]|uniref:pentatricopeptide repeat-containing protein At2g20710, mitochondrial-like n=1 Tax=Pistacia vera TaxID=55513 RepID=UPI001262B348|nr:pentatricopeptide repeat-containing protein At2g20710, mitochondrial-like [Pistacia vera]
MKFVSSRTILESIKLQLRLGNVSRISSYSTATRNLTTERRSTNPDSNSMRGLFRRITPLGDPTVSIVPLLDQWVQEGRTVEKEQLQLFIKELRSFRRFTHALQISMWMTDKRYLPLTSADVAIRLDLISKVHGLERAENYFNNVAKQLRRFAAYSALLNCYANAKSVEKAEATMQEMSDLGLSPRTPSVYNSMLNLYYQTGNYEKLDSLMHEMKEKGIGYDKITCSIRLSAYAAASDVEGIDKIVNLMESNPTVLLDWKIYGTAASGYAKAGFLDKSFQMLKKSEGLISGKSHTEAAKAYHFLITQNATNGQKDEVLRLWEIYKKNVAIYNRGYISVIKSMLKFDDLETAEKIFEDWDSQSLSNDIRIPNFLIGSYCRKGLLHKAESLISKAKLKGEKPNCKTWFYMATGYLKNNQTLEAVEAMKEALVVCRNKWKPSKEHLASSLTFLNNGVENIVGVEKFINLLREKDIISEGLQGKWLNNVQNGKLNFDELSKFYSDALIDDAEAPSAPEADKDDSVKEQETC